MATALSPGLGARLFCTPWLAIDLEARDPIDAEKQEATSIVSAVQLRLGVSVFPSGF